MLADRKLRAKQGGIKMIENCICVAEIALAASNSVASALSLPHCLSINSHSHAFASHSNICSDNQFKLIGDCAHLMAAPCALWCPCNGPMRAKRSHLRSTSVCVCARASACNVAMAFRNLGTHAAAVTYITLIGSMFGHLLYTRRQISIVHTAERKIISV